jgi:diguanylate cyclase (GGDEF)-like protein/PAS domain S-box-containing protein
MGYQNKTNNELIKEISTLHQQITKLKKFKDKNKQELTEIKTLLDKLPQIVYEVNKKGNIAFLNQTAFKISGFTKSDLKNGLPALQMFIPKDRKRALNNIQKILNGNKLQINEYTAIKKDGSTLPLVIHGIPKYKDGKIIGIRGIAFDISKLKKTEKTLLKSQQEFSNLFKSSPEALVYIDEKSNILDVNAQFTKLFGYTLKEIKGKNVDNGMVHSQKMICEGKKLTKKAFKGFVNYETIRKRKDGSEFPVFISSSPVKINNKLKGLITLYQDITERKKAEEELRQSEEKFAGIFKNIPEAAFYQDTKGIILDVNPAFTRLFDYTREDIMGKNVDEIGLYPKDKMKEGKGLTRKTLNEDLTNFETVRQKKDETLVPVRISTSFVKIKDKVIGIITLYQDITEQKQNEQLQQVLYNISKAANSSISLKQLYSLLHQELGKIIDTTNFYIALVDEKEGKVFFPYHVDEKEDDFNPQELKSNKSLTCYIIKNGSSFLLNFNTIKELIKYKELTNPGVITEKISWLGVPLKIEHRVIGTIAVQSYTNPNLYSKSDIKLMEFVSEQVATAIERKRMEEELKKLAHHDPLTGTYNRGYGLELLQRQVKLAKRNKTSFLLAYTDLDNLKNINDEFGHDEGDKVITQVANLFQSTLRDVDIIIRMGGDEFLLVFPDSSLKEITIIKKRFYDELALQNRDSNKPYKIGFSIGFSCYDFEHPKSIEDLMRIADQKMYKNKKG